MAANRKSKLSVSQDAPSTSASGAPLDALGDPTRRSIVEALRHGPLAVGELAAKLPVSRPAVSQHLAVLRAAGLVSVTPEGTRRIVSLDPAGLDELRAYAERLWTDALDGLELVAESDAQKVHQAGAPRDR